MGGLQVFCLLGFMVLVASQTTLGSDLKDQKTEIPDEDFSTLLGLLTQLLVTNRADMKSLQHSIEVVQETMQELKLRVDNLENSNSQLNNAIIKTQEQVDWMSSNLTSLQAAAVTNLRLGPSEEGRIWNGNGFEDSYGYIITGVYNWNANEVAEFVYRRKMQVQINGNWVDMNQE